MASQLEQLASDVHAVASDADGRAALLAQARSQVNALASRAHSLRVQDVDLRPLIQALDQADHLLSAAVADVQTAKVRSMGYAASLAIRAAGSGGVGSGGQQDSPSALDSALAARGLRMGDVNSFDFSDNPITSWGKASRDDVEWAVSRWDDTIAPGIAQGATRADFETMDAQNGSGDMRRLAPVWDYFLGDDAIHGGGSLPGGGMDVGGGRHRLQVARDLGIRFLPIRFH